MSMADWLEPFLVVMPAMAWFFLGIGIPWAGALLPRRDWGDWATVVGVGLALGPLLGTTWLFLLGTFGHFSFMSAFVGTFLIAIVGAGLAWLNRKQLSNMDKLLPPKEPYFRTLTITLLVMMGIGLLANIWDTAFWPFLRYDTLWTFGYNPKIFMLEKQIPDWIDYYPQLVPLSYTFADLAWGSSNDHAARAAIPWFIVSSTFSAYVLGWRIYGKRVTGLLTAALWLLLPSSLVWSSSGDLEQPMTIYFTLTTVFFVLAWREDQTRYAVIAGFMLAGALWTKPTAGALILGIGLVLVGTLIVDRKMFPSKFRISVISLLVAAPIGGMWYVRNVLLGHQWTDLPASYWQDLAQRSGMQLHWLWFLGGLVAVIIILRTDRRRAINAGLGFGLISLAILPTGLSIPDDGWSYATSWDWINGFREPTRSLSLNEGISLLIGVGLLGGSGWQLWKRQAQFYQQGFLLTWGLALPFFVVYFWSFSYHYRLALTVLPIIFAPIAALLVIWVLPLLMENRLRRLATVVIVIFLSLPAPIATTYHTALNTFNKTGIDTDAEKYQYANPALMQLVNHLKSYEKELRLLAPGENRLKFFFPTWKIEDETLPTDLVELAGYDLFVSYAADFLWGTNHLTPNQVQAWTDLAWIYPLAAWDQVWSFDGPNQTALPRVFRPVTQPFDDGKDRYEVFEINLAAASLYVEPETVVEDVIFGGKLQLLGYDFPTTAFQRGSSYTVKFYWRGVGEGPQQDYSIYIHVLAPDHQTVLTQFDAPIMGEFFPMRLLAPDMIVQDRRVWYIPTDLKPSNAFLRIGIYDPVSGQRLLIGENDGIELVEIEIK